MGIKSPPLSLSFNQYSSRQSLEGRVSHALFSVLADTISFINEISIYISSLATNLFQIRDKFADNLIEKCGVCEACAKLSTSKFITCCYHKFCSLKPLRKHSIESLRKVLT